MNNLYNALINGEIVYKDGGIVETRPPTAVMLRASRAIDELVKINENNVMIINQLQQREAALINELNQLKEFYATYGTSNDQSIRDGQPEVGDVGSSSPGSPGSN